MEKNYRSGKKTFRTLTLDEMQAVSGGIGPVGILLAIAALFFATPVNNHPDSDRNRR